MGVKKTRIQIQVDEKMLNLLTDKSEELGVSRSSLINAILTSADFSMSFGLCGEEVGKYTPRTPHSCR